MATAEESPVVLQFEGGVQVQVWVQVKLRVQVWISVVHQRLEIRETSEL